MPRVFLLMSVLFAIGAAPALADSGNGLYKPYPAASAPDAAQSYYAQLGTVLAAAQLHDGHFSPGLGAPPAAGGPSLRAGARAVDLGYAELAVIGALALLAAAGAALLPARRSPPDVSAAVR